MIDREKVALAIQDASVPHDAGSGPGSRSLGYYLALGIDAVAHDIERAPVLTAKAADAAIAAVLEQVELWLWAESKLCDCFAREEGECACGAWDDYKSVPMPALIDRFKTAFLQPDSSPTPVE